MEKLQITARGMRLSDAIKLYIQKKMNKVGKVFNRNVYIHCEIIKKKARIGVNDYLEVEISVSLPKAYIKVGREGENFYQLIDELEPLLIRKIDKYKEKRVKKNKKLKFSQVALNM